MLYFAATRPEHEYDDGDSTELGQLAVLQLYPHRAHPDVLRKEVIDFISLVRVLRSCQAKYRFLDEFLYHIVMNSMKKGAKQTGFIVNSPLAALTANESGQIARSFVMLLMSNISGEAAVDEFILTYPALADTDSEFKWFRPMMTAIASDLMSKVAYGTKVRAGVGATVSILDLVSDTAIIIQYFGADSSTEFAYVMIGLVAANVLLQLFIVWVQTRDLKKGKWKTMLLEMLTTVLFLKPGLDAWKVASGAEQKPGSSFPPITEMTFSKCLEMIIEAVPGFVLQSIAIVSAERKSKTAIASLVISAASAGLTATSLFYDIDVDPTMRKRNPIWCGAVPNQGRGVAFFTVFMMCTLHVLAKGAATALLTTADFHFLKIYMAVDYGLYFIFCFARKDFVYYTAAPLVASVIMSPIVRVVVKALGDFSGTPLVRLPLNLGGAYYMFNQISAQASVLVAVHVYNKHANDGTGTKLSAGTLWNMACFLVGAWCVTMVFFLSRVVNPSHRHTFWSAVSGRQCVQSSFVDGTTDEEKLSTCGCNRLLWEGDIGSQMMEFTHQNWARWDREQPKWFTPNLIATVPDEYIPREHLAGLGGAQRLRRGSAAGSVRESFRMS
jgi:hypothetical protein